jgi:hypothetical protein
MERAILMLTTVLAATTILPSSHAEIILPTFTAGNGASDLIAHSGSDVFVPITVVGFNEVYSAQFSLSWDTTVLHYVEIANPNSQLQAGDTWSFNTTQVTGGQTGKLGWLWSDVLRQTLNDGAIIFKVRFTASGSAGTRTDISFGDAPVEQNVMASDSKEYLPITDNGGVFIVPEHINGALGFFSCILIGGGTIRLIRSRFLRPAV